MTEQSRMDDEWLALLLCEQDLFERICVEKEVTRAAVMEWWKAVADVFVEYKLRLFRFGSMDIEGNRLGPMPPHLSIDLTQRICNLMGELAVGNRPDPVRALSARGSPKPGPAEIDDIRLAVAYYRASQSEGLKRPDGSTIAIPDPTPVKTIQQLYKVSKTTVRGWVKSYNPPDFVLTPRKTFVDDDKTAAWSEEARGLMFRVHRAAEHYQSISRSSRAVRQRDSKRTVGRKPKVRRSSKRR